MYTFKGTVKRLEFNAGNADNENTYHVSFDYCDSNKVRVNETEYGVAYEGSKLDSLEMNESFIIQKDLFDLLSQNAKEDLEISYEYEDNKTKNKIIKKVVLCYE